MREVGCGIEGRRSTSNVLLLLIANYRITGGYDVALTECVFVSTCVGDGWGLGIIVEKNC